MQFYICLDLHFSQRSSLRGHRWTPVANMAMLTFPQEINNQDSQKSDGKNEDNMVFFWISFVSSMLVSFSVVVLQNHVTINPD